MVHAGSLRLVRQLPENWLPPLFVTALMTPPLNRPYSRQIRDDSRNARAPRQPAIAIDGLFDDGTLDRRFAAWMPSRLRDPTFRESAVNLHLYSESLDHT